MFYVVFLIDVQGFFGFCLAKKGFVGCCDRF